LLYGSRDAAACDALLDAAGWELPSPDPVDLAGRWVAELDRHGVRRAALLASLPGDEDSVEAAVSAYPDRFYGYFIVNPLLPGAAEHVRQRLSAGLLRVPCLFPAMHRYSLHDDLVVPVLDAVAGSSPNPVVFVHCGVLSVGIRRRLGLPSPFDMRYSNPIDLHAIALRFPHVSFVVPHFGGGYFREALMLADLCPNVFLDTSSSNSWIRYEGLTLETVFRRALEVAGAARLLFGTDSSFFPRGWNRAVFEQQAKTLDQLNVGPAEQAAIFGGNLRRLLQSNPA
jgi:predicted TIM-barrel fold metal-dependent hydrolase